MGIVLSIEHDMHYPCCLEVEDRHGIAPEPLYQFHIGLALKLSLNVNIASTNMRVSIHYNHRHPSLNIKIQRLKLAKQDNLNSHLFV
jgi:hypothetical protein